MLRKACKRLVGRLGWKRSHCRKTATATASAELDHAAASGASVQEPVLADMERSNRRSPSPEFEAEVPVQSHPADIDQKVFVPPVHFEDWSTPYLRIHPRPDSSKTASSDGTCTLMLPAAVRNAASESDSGVCLDDGEIQMAEQECLEEEEEEEEDYEEDEEEEWECNCDECFFALCEEQLDDWHISAKDMSLEKVLSSEDGEVVYSGYWHGSVTVHLRQNEEQALLNCYIDEARTLSKIRHENIQLFLGVCLDLQCDSVALVMSDLKGESLHTRLHRTNQEFTFSAMTKVINQIVQGMAYLHDRGIAHPLLTSKSISIHYRACISMLSPSTNSNSVDSSQLVYLPPEAIRTLHPTLPNLKSRTPSRRLLTYPANQDKLMANVFSFGTIIYELVTASLPFAGTPGELIIWEVGNGHCQPLSQLHEGKLKDIIQRCWLPEHNQRPSFKELLGTLEQNLSPRACGLKAYFSFSEPSQLAKTGLW